MVDTRQIVSLRIFNSKCLQVPFITHVDLFSTHRHLINRLDDHLQPWWQKKKHHIAIALNYNKHFLYIIVAFLHKFRI